MKDEDENGVLNSFSNIAPYLKLLFDEEVAFAVTDTEKYLDVTINEKLPLKSGIGDKIPEGGAIYEALKKGEVVIKDVGKEIYGTAFKSYAIPIKNSDDKVIGVIVAGKSIEKRMEVLALSESLAGSLNEISLVVQNVAKVSKELANSNRQVVEEVEKASETTKDTDGIIGFVQNISSQTNLLGLNAAIEAARAGEAGKGFSVVAQEIRKLSNSTTESIKKIDSVIKEIGEAVRKISQRVNESNSFLGEQSTSFQEITASIEELNKEAQILKKMAGKL